MPLTWRTTPRGVIDRTHWSRDAVLRWCRPQGRAMGSLRVDHLLARRLEYMALGGARGRRVVGRGEGGRGIQPYVVLRVPRCLLWPAERGRRRRVELCAPARGARGRGASTTFAMHPGPGEIATGVRRRSARRGLVGRVSSRSTSGRVELGVLPGPTPVSAADADANTRHIRYDDYIKYSLFSASSPC